MNAVDTNILIYAHDPREADKQAIALDLVEQIDDGILLWQVVCEFVAASRKLAPIGFSIEDAIENIRDLKDVWTLAVPGFDVIDRADDLISRFSLSFWDALIIGASLEAGVNRLYSEDFDAYPNIDGMEVVNPFATP